MDAEEQSCIEDEVDLLLTITENVWVQCDNPDCQKWRKIHKDVAAKLGPSIPWFCHMNADSKANNCSKPEDDQILYEKVARNAGIKFVMSELEVGDLVWAKTPGYCRWPAVISKDPHCGLHTQLDVDGDPFSYHVEYLGNPHTHCWVYTRHVELYGHKNNKTVETLKTKVESLPGTWGKKGRMKKKGKRLTFTHKTARSGLEDAVEEAESLLNMSKQARLQLMVFEHEPPGLQCTDNYAPKYEKPLQETEIKQSQKCKSASKSTRHKRKSDETFVSTQLQGHHNLKRSRKQNVKHSKAAKTNSKSFINSKHHQKIARRGDLEDEAVVPSNIPRIFPNDTSMYYEEADQKMMKIGDGGLQEAEGLYNIADFEKMVRELQGDIEGSSLYSQEVTDLDDDCLPLSFNFQDSEILPSFYPDREETQQLRYLTGTTHNLSRTSRESPVLLEDLESDLLAMEDYFMEAKDIDTYTQL